MGPFASPFSASKALLSPAWNRLQHGLPSAGSQGGEGTLGFSLMTLLAFPCLLERLAATSLGLGTAVPELILSGHQETRDPTPGETG